MSTLGAHAQGAANPLSFVGVKKRAGGCVNFLPLGAGWDSRLDGRLYWISTPDSGPVAGRPSMVTFNAPGSLVLIQK